MAGDALAAAIRRIADHQQAMRVLAEEMAAERDARTAVPTDDTEVQVDEEGP